MSSVKKENENEKEGVTQRIRIKIRAYDHKLIDQSVKQIVETAQRYGAQICGPVPLPTEFHKYTVNSATFKYKDSREQFEMRVHKRLIDVGADERTLRLVMRVPIPENLNIEIEMVDI